MKKIITIIIAIIVAITCLSFNAFAEDDKLMSVYDIANDWINTQFDGNAEVSNIIKLFDYEQNYVGDIICFEHNSVPLGYVTLSKLENGDPVIEFSFEGGSIYSELNNQRSKSVSKMHNNATVVEDILITDFANYSLLTVSDNKLCTFSINQTEHLYSTSNSFLRKAAAINNTTSFYDDYHENIIRHDCTNYGDIPGTYFVNALVMSNMPRPTNVTGNCSPTAFANLVKLYSEAYMNGNSPLYNLRVNGNDIDTYNRITQIIGHCSVPTDKLISGTVDYCFERGFSCSINNYWFDLWSDFKRDVDNSIPIYLHTAGSIYNASTGEYELSGHAQVVVGYREYSDGSLYLHIFSGWYDHPSFVKFKPDSLVEFDGYSVSIH